MAFDREIAALTIFCEASGEPPEGRVAVAATLFNRLRAKRFGPTIAAICLARYQYSEWNDDKADNANLLRAAGTPDDNPVMQECLQAFLAAAAGQDPTGGATHYFAVSIPEPSWAATGEFTVQIGRHRFYKNVP